MKRIILLILPSIYFGCWGPDSGERDLYTYTVQNETESNITIKSYLSDFPNIHPIITNLSIGEKLTKTYLDGLPPRGYGFNYFFAEENSSRDSLVIIFDNQKISKFNGDNCVDKRNPLNLCEYGGLNETFVFTKQDYENALPCDGNCD